MGKILVEGIEVYAYHGCLEAEGKIGGKYIVDVELNTDLKVAAETDRLEETIDYVDVYKIVTREMAVRARLIEHVGKRILDSLMVSFPSLKMARVKVTKVNPPMNGNVKQVAVVLECEK